MLARFFANRPVFASVISIVIMLAEGLVTSVVASSTIHIASPGAEPCIVAGARVAWTVPPVMRE